jgi:hypothetical protein
MYLNILFIYLLSIQELSAAHTVCVCVNYLLFNEENFHSLSFNSTGWAGNNELQRV